MEERQVVDVEIRTLRRLNNNLNVGSFCFPLHRKHTCIDLLWLCADAYHRARTAVAGRLLHEFWALQAMQSFKLFRISVFRCHAPGLCSGNIPSRNGYASAIFQVLHTFRRLKCLSEQRTILRLPYLGDRSMTCLSNGDRKIMTRTQKNATKFYLTESR